MKNRSPFSLLVSFTLLMGFWLVMSGHYSLFHITLGVMCVGLVMALDATIKKMAFFEDEVDSLRVVRFSYLPYYAGWLLVQIIVSGVHVARIILDPKLPINTAIVTFRVNLPNTQARVILGNSITLTPGTLTLSIEGDRFTVHALSPASYEGIIDDTMPRKVLQLFSKESHRVVHDVTITKAEGA